jgi:hypothetical protein
MKTTFHSSDWHTLTRVINDTWGKKLSYVSHEVKIVTNFVPVTRKYVLKYASTYPLTVIYPLTLPYRKTKENSNGKVIYKDTRMM